MKQRHPHGHWDILRQLGKSVRSHRRARSLTQEALADLVGLSVAYVSLIERGGRNPPFTTVVALARALAVPPSVLVAGDGVTHDEEGPSATSRRGALVEPKRSRTVPRSRLS